MFEILLKKSDVFKKILDSVADLTKNVNIICSDRKIVINTMDSAKVSFIHIILNDEGFEKYRCDEDITFGIDIKSFSKVFKYGKTDAKLALKGTDDTRLTLILEETENRIKTYDMVLLHLDQDVLEVPEQSYPFVIRLPSAVFYKICHDLGQFGEVIAITCTEKAVKFQTTGDDTTANIKIPVTANDVYITAEEYASITLIYSAKYLNYFTRATPLAAEVALYLSEDAPMLVKYKLKDLGSIDYYLAPKFEDDD